MKFVQRLAERRPLLLDGAMGTMLQASGLPAGVSPEEFCMERPDILQGIHKAYLDAGVDIITSCTFGGNPCKLPASLDVFTFNKRMVETARAAAAQAGRPVFVAGNVGPSGHFARPLGDMEPEELIKAFSEQIRGLVAGGADLIFIETQFDLAEARAAVTAARQVCDLPVMVSMTFEQGVSLTGSSPTIFAETMQNMGVAALGTNCSLGPDQMLPVVEELLSVCSCPVVAEPNAGLPELRGSETVFPLGPEAFAQKTAAFAARGARVLGGCCGTTPQHLAALRQALESVTCDERPVVSPSGICLTSRSQLLRLGEGQPFSVIGERINPTGKKELTRQLQAGQFDEAFRLADEQLQAGARILDVNVGAHNVNQVELLPRLVAELVMRHTIPLSLDSSDDDAILAAMPWCPASFLVNSINGARGRMERLGSACRDFGMPFILLPMRDAKLPVKAEERIAILEDLLREADSLNIPRRLVMVDVLALAISSKPEGAVECLKLLSWCRENGLATTIGLSNISFGLPARELINSSFLLMAAGSGLNSCIANPASARIREAVASANLLLAKDDNAAAFIGAFADWKSGTQTQAQGKAVTVPGSAKAAASPGEAVLQGDRDRVTALIDEELARGTNPFDIVNGQLIPAITEVGSLYEKKVYFLPQLIRSAETMQKAFAHVKPLLAKESDEERPTIVLATVEGDVHDIGKNIVKTVLENYGYRIIDLGKNVPCEEVVRACRENGVKLCGLSALMTTTVDNMRLTVEALKEACPDCKVMVGGAVLTADYAEKIGADRYCRDAAESARYAGEVFANRGLERERKK